MQRNTCIFNGNIGGKRLLQLIPSKEDQNHILEFLSGNGAFTEFSNIPTAKLIDQAANNSVTETSAILKIHSAGVTSLFITATGNALN